MPKLKTKKGVAKRFKLTKKKKIVFHPGGKSHLGTAKESERIRKMRRAATLKNKKAVKYLKRLLPYA